MVKYQCWGEACQMIWPPFSDSIWLVCQPAHPTTSWPLMLACKNSLKVCNAMRNLSSLHLWLVTPHIYIACFSSIWSSLVTHQWNFSGEACWWTIHPASKQRSEGEKVRVGDDLILVSVATERYLVSAEMWAASCFIQYYDCYALDVTAYHQRERCLNRQCFLSRDPLVSGPIRHRIEPS